MRFNQHCYRHIQESRLLRFGPESPVGPEHVPDLKRAAETGEFLPKLQEVQGEGDKRMEAANSDMKSVEANLAAPSADIDMSLGKESVDALLTMALKGALAVDNLLHPKEPEEKLETTEQLPETPNEKLWQEFIELGNGLQNKERFAALREGFMTIGPDRAQAMLNSYENMTLEERADFDGVIAQNSVLLKDFTDEGFAASIAILLAKDHEERMRITANLPEADRTILAERWPQESSMAVREFFAGVDMSISASSTDTLQPEAPLDIQQESEKIQNPILRSLLLKFADILQGDPLSIDAKHTGEELQELLPEEQNFAFEMIDIQGDEQPAIVFEQSEPVGTLHSVLGKGRVHIVNEKLLTKIRANIEGMQGTV